MKKVRKAIIPAAGLGTRFLPATKAMPKEMLPIIDKPTIQYIVEEAVASGIEDIIIVTGKGKRAIEDHFDHAVELERNLLEKGKHDLLNEVRKCSNIVDIHYIRQKEAKGLGHAVWCARRFIGDEPFAVLLGDDIVKSYKPCLKQLMEQYDATGSSIIGVKPMPKDLIGRYGVVETLSTEDERLFRITNMIEKPEQGETESELAIMGRYVLTPEIFDLLGSQDAGSGGEIQLTDAMKRLTDSQQMYAYHFEGIRYDVGDKLGYILTTLDFAMQNSELRYPLIKAMEDLLIKEKVLEMIG